MKIIEEKLYNTLIPEEGYLLHDKTEVIEEGQEPYYTDIIYLPKTITLEQCEEIYEEVLI